MQITRKRLAHWLTEYRRVYQIVRKTRKLIHLSRYPEERRDPKWAEERSALQAELEFLCAEDIHESFEEVGVAFRMLHDGDDSILTVTDEPDATNRGRNR